MNATTRMNDYKRTSIGLRVQHIESWICCSIFAQKFRDTGINRRRLKQQCAKLATFRSGTDFHFLELSMLHDFSIKMTKSIDVDSVGVCVCWCVQTRTCCRESTRSWMLGSCRTAACFHSACRQCRSRCIRRCTSISISIITSTSSRRPPISRHQPLRHLQPDHPVSSSRPWPRYSAAAVVVVTWLAHSTAVPQVPQIEPMLQTVSVFFTKITAICSFGHRRHTHCSAYVNSAFHPPRDGKWVSTLWLSNNTWRWANVRSIAAYRRTQRSSWPTSWRPPSASRHSFKWPEWTLEMAWP